MELLPIGSVVLLKEGVKTVMIFGRKQIDDEGILWDYISCLYPEGNIDADLNFLFNNDDIEKVVFKGYENEEEIQFRKTLKTLEESIKDEEN